MIKTAEFVSPLHPDKQCDVIADALLDAFLKDDKGSRVALEVMGGHDLLVVNGEVTSATSVDIEKVVREFLPSQFKVIVNAVPQSPEIARGVDTGGAGDQGIMVGYACRDTENFMPYEYELARALCKHLFEKYPYDGKTQVTVETNEGKRTLKTVVASFQNAKQEDLKKAVEEFLATRKDIDVASADILANPAGDWAQGGFDADTGLSGRKIIIDNYGPEHSVGGGSFSGKDYTKVDRSGAYMARRIAIDLLKKYPEVKEARVKLAYAIGKKEPVMAVALLDGKEEAVTGYDLSPKGIREYLKLDTLTYVDLARWGHFGHATFENL